MSSERGIGLRLVLAALALALVAPISVIGALLVRSSWQQQIANVDRQNIETARAISVAIDQEVENTSNALNLIGALELFDTPALPGFEELAHRVIPREAGWYALLLADAEGRRLHRAALSTGPDDVPASSPSADLAWARDVIATGRPVVTDIIQRAGMPGHFVVAAIPVTRRGVVQFVLGAQMRTEAFTRVLRRQQVPPNGVITLLDRNRRILARTRNEPQYVGTLPSKGFLDASARMSEGSWRETLLEGEDAYAGLSRSSLTGWTVGVGLSAAAVDGPVRRSLWLLLAASLIALGAAAAMAVWFTRAFSRSFGEASNAVMALARSEPATMPPSRVREINVLASGVAAAAETLQARLLERDQAERLKEEFLMTLSHELRTPLTAITGWSHMLVTGQIREGQSARAIASIQRNAASLTQLVEDLLDVSRSVSGKLRLDVEPIDFGAVVQAAVDTVRPAAAAKDIEIVVDIDPAAVSVMGDASRLRQVVWNLLSNAVKFTPPGGRVEVTVARAPAGERVAGLDMVQIAVSDTGPGIDPAFMPFVFDRFRQGATGPTRPHGGLGLGLAIVQQLVELHGGTVRVENNASGVGAAFFVNLPPGTQARARNAPTVARAASAVPRLDDASVLIIDDEPQARERFAAILEGAGAEVRTAASRDDALFIMQTWLPLVILVDLEMPDGGALTLLERVRALYGDQPGAIAISGSMGVESRAALAAGVHCHLERPVEPEALVVAVSALVLDQSASP